MRRVMTSLPSATLDLAPADHIALMRAVLSEGGRLHVPGRGWSMFPLLHDGDRVLVEPFTRAPRIGDVALVDAAGRAVVHRVIALDAARVITRGDASADADRPLPAGALLGRAVAVVRGGRTIALDVTLRFGVGALLRHLRGRLSARAVRGRRAMHRLSASAQLGWSVR